MDEDKTIKAFEDIASIKTGMVNMEGHITRLDKRINGTFHKIGEHIDESPEYREAIVVLQTDVKAIKEEKLNTTKNAQWRIGLICGIPALVLVILKIWDCLKKIIIYNIWHDYYFGVTEWKKTIA